MLMVKMRIPGSFAASSSKRFVCASHTGVSSDGTTLNIRTPPPVFAKFTGCKAASTTSKSGATSPTLSAEPASGTDFPPNIVVRFDSVLFAIAHKCSRHSGDNFRQFAGKIPATVNADFAFALQAAEKRRCLLQLMGGRIA